MQQYLALIANAVSTGNGSVRNGGLTWNFIACPSPLSREYNLQILFKQGKTPKVFVVAPDLQSLAGERKLPHVYAQNPPKLCLFYPRAREWSEEMFISETIVPWAILWLFYFEEWLYSNEWKGGGIHPKTSTNSSKKVQG